jgi:HAD superfamily hydrolase (TIGR01509 family)
VIRAVVFDFDGTVFDSESHEFAVIGEIFREHGAELSLDVWSQCIGREAGFFDPLAHLEECIGRPVDRDALRELRHRRFHERIAHHGPMEGVVDALDAADEHGLRIGLASSSTRWWVRGQLERLGLLERFGAIRTAEDVERVKPEPDLYLAVCDALGVRPDEAIAFEDSPNGALAARRAGLRCVIVPNSVTATLSFGDADLRAASMREVRMADLIERFASGG